MKLNGHTQWYVRSVAIEWRLLSLARSRDEAPAKIGDVSSTRTTSHTVILIFGPGHGFSSKKTW